MSVKDRAAFEAMNALRALKQFDDFDADVYFSMAARQLLGSHGAQAIVLADAALERMRAAGDFDGCALWKEVRAAMDQHIQEFEEAPAPRYATMH